MTCSPTFFQISMMINFKKLYFVVENKKLHVVNIESEMNPKDSHVYSNDVI
jgi:hypothetical protein